ncbi:hypothetical protein [Arthrobacter sp. RAF14]
MNKGAYWRFAGVGGVTTAGVVAAGRSPSPHPSPSSTVVRDAGQLRA